MKIFNNHRHLLFFIGGSLLLLVVLEGFWLKKLYSEERQNLRKEIEQVVFKEVTSTQINLMQKNNVRLIDSFLLLKDEEKKQVKIHYASAYAENGKLLSQFDYINNEQARFLKKLDTLADFNFGTEKENKEINEFLRTVREDFKKRKVNQKPSNEEDSVKLINDFVQNQKRAYTSLWYIYRLVENSPTLNRQLMDSFFNAQTQYFMAIYPTLWHIDLENSGSKIKRNVKNSENIAYKTPIGDKLNIFINTASSSESKSPRDSFLKQNTYEFQRFISGMANPSQIKTRLEEEFKTRGLHFDVSKIDVSSMVSNSDNAIINTFPAGTKFFGMSSKDQKIAIATTGYQPLIFKTIATEILFALFVLGMVAASFWLIYRSFLQQKHLITLKNDFISNITHELKTPITTVGVAIEAMNSFDALKNPTQTKEYLDISKNELNRLSLLVDKVLKMAIFEQNKPQLVLEKFDLNDLTEQILTSMQLQFDKYQATISIETIGENFTINADKTHITSVIYNLIDNALKYGGEKPTVQLTIEAPFYEFVLFSVKDSGAGIPPQYKDKIFEKFFRIPTGDVHDTKGHGLGLSYVASVVEQHGGKINLESKEGLGSTFSVFLPHP